MKSNRTTSRGASLSAPAARVLLALCTASIVLAAAAGVYLVSNLTRIHQMQAQLLASADLQERLLSRNPLDNCLFPHQIPAIGYVLNSHMKTGTLWADPDTPYEINSIGLRGAEISPKKPGTARIVLLGDSWFFGVGLEEADRLQSKIQKILDTRIDSQSYEVVTVAIPGWNVTSEAAFLEAHLEVIDPDVILWEICANDVEDLAGVAPPGVLAPFLSAQARNPCAFTRIQQARTPTPFILDRFRRALATMEDLHNRLQIPFLITPVDISPPMMGIIQQPHTVGIPLYFIPPQYRKRLEYRVKVSDSHPSARMNEIMAVAYLHHLSSLEIIPEFPIDNDETPHLDRWRSHNARPVTPAQMTQYIHAQQASVSQEYSTVTGFHDVSAGMVDDDKMAGCGVAFLRVEPARTTVRMEIESTPSSNQPRRLTVAIHSPSSPKVESTHELDAGITQVFIPLAAPPSTSEVVEVHWNFSSVVCSTPTLCYGARLTLLDTL